MDAPGPTVYATARGVACHAPAGTYYRACADGVASFSHVRL